MIYVIPYQVISYIFEHFQSFGKLFDFLFSLEKFKSFDNDSLKMSFISKSALTNEKSIDIDCLDLFSELKVLRKVTIKRKEQYSIYNFFFYVI
jgi:hypothetical protein